MEHPRSPDLTDQCRYWLEKQKSMEPFIFLMYDTVNRSAARCTLSLNFARHVTDHHSLSARVFQQSEQARARRTQVINRDPIYRHNSRESMSLCPVVTCGRAVMQVRGGGAVFEPGIW